MSTPNRSSVPLLGLLLAGCMIGPSTQSFRVAQSPAGALATFRLTSARWMRGELLAVHDEGLLAVRSDSLPQRVVLVAYGAIRKVEVSQAEGAGQVGAKERERLRLLSRYPQGVSTELLRRLLQTYEQPELDRIQP